MFKNSRKSVKSYKNQQTRINLVKMSNIEQKNWQRLMKDQWKIIKIELNYPKKSRKIFENWTKFIGQYFRIYNSKRIFHYEFEKYLKNFSIV